MLTFIIRLAIHYKAKSCPDAGIVSTGGVTITAYGGTGVGVVEAPCFFVWTFIENIFRYSMHTYVK